MAEAGAHLTAATDDRPSVFEVLAQETLLDAVRPALKHVVKVLSESNPARWGVLWRRFDELYLLLDVLLQNHFLSAHAASFSENFYGLRRVPASLNALPVRRPGLSRKDHLSSLLLLCLAPYLRAKLEGILARQREEEDFSIRLAGSRIQKLYRGLLGAWPYLRAAWDAWRLCQTLLYVFGRARAHSPLLWLARVQLAHLTAEDLRDGKMKTHINTAGLSMLQRAWHAATGVAEGVAISLSSGLSLGVFLLQFLEWWYSSENQTSTRSLIALPIPPPPIHLMREPLPPSPNQEVEGGKPSNSANQSSADRVCPLCRRPRTNEAVLSTSGFVFCYRCVYVYVKANQRCPVTGYPTELQHLVKIYSPES